MLLILVYLVTLDQTLAGFSGKIVGGDYAEIKTHSHSVFLSISNNAEDSWICGSSILNQRILLTAAHCLEFCTSRSHIAAIFGNEHRSQGWSTSAASYKMHEFYDGVKIKNDISLIYLKNNLPFGPKAARVSVSPHPPKDDNAVVAGWGIVDEDNNIGTKWLKQARQKLLGNNECKRILKEVIEGTICAGQHYSNGFASEGDSGSALIIKGYIQVGLVSYKDPKYSRSVVVYTDVSYFYNWIVSSSKRLYCSGR